MKTRADLKKKILLCNGMGHSRHGHSASLGNISGSEILVILKIKTSADLKEKSSVT
jgi:hypothetical protein